MTTQNGCYTTNGEGRIVVVVVLRDADAPVHFLRLASVPALHLPISHTNSPRTLTSIASPGLNGSKSIVLLAFSAASFDSSRISALALSLTAIARPLPFVWFLQFNVFRIRFDVEWERADVIWRPLLRTLFHLGHFARKGNGQHPGCRLRHRAYELLGTTCQHRGILS